MIKYCKPSPGRIRSFGAPWSYYFNAKPGSGLGLFLLLRLILVLESHGMQAGVVTVLRQ